MKRHISNKFHGDTEHITTNYEDNKQNAHNNNHRATLPRHAPFLHSIILFYFFKRSNNTCSIKVKRNLKSQRQQGSEDLTTIITKKLISVEQLPRITREYHRKTKNWQFTPDFVLRSFYI